MSEGTSTESKDFTSLSPDEQTKWVQQAVESYNAAEESNATPKEPFSLETLQTFLKNDSLPEEERKEYQEMADILERWERAQSESSQLGATQRELYLNGPTELLDHSLDGSVMLEIEVVNPNNNGAWTPINLVNRYGSIVLHWNARPHDDRLVLNSYYKGWYSERWDYWGDKLGEKGGFIFLARKASDARKFYFATQKYGGVRMIWMPYTTPGGTWTAADRINYQCGIPSRAAFGPKIWWKTYNQ